MDRDRELLRHFLVAIAYRFQKAVRGAPAHYPDFSAGHQARTPAPVPPENFIHARIDGARLGADQAAPASPDEHWPERPK